MKRSPHSDAPIRVQVVVAGFNRSLSSTIHSIYEKVIEPARAFDADTQVSFVLSTTLGSINNPRSGELGTPEQQMPVGYAHDSLLEWDQQDIDIATERQFIAAKRNGNPWPDDDFLSLRNVVRFLYLLDRAYDTVDRRADWVVFMRPDLECLDALDYSSHLSRPQRSIVTPSWHQFGGLNDRVAILPKRAVRAYFRRFRRINAFLKTGQPLHAETFLAFCLRDFTVAPVMTERFQRIRVGGRPHLEDFSA